MGAGDVNETLREHGPDAVRERHDQAWRQRRGNGAAELPDLIVWSENLPATVEELRDLLAASGRLYDRGMPVRIVKSAEGSPPSAAALTKHAVVIEAHRVCRPVKQIHHGERLRVTLPDRVAQMYLEMTGEWNLPPLAGVSTAPLLAADGSIRTAHGYDRAMALWCATVPSVAVPVRPSRADAVAALELLRETFRTFPFGDAARRQESAIETIDPTAPIGRDESAFLAGLLTAVCRPSLGLAPGLLLTAAAVSGAGSGKGLLVRAICAIAYAIRPRAFTAGGDRKELDKRLAAELVEAQPALFLDNVNGTALRSDTLAAVLTERPARVRMLGQTRMVPLNSAAFIAVTGNGLTVTEDLARRFIWCELDARCEDPELRPFAGGFLDEIERRRTELLRAALTIWRWGRQTPLDRGIPLGSYETWAAWCRDPLLALGCRDPVERIATLKTNDPRRRHIAELYAVWWEHHRDAPIKASDLAEPVRAIADPQGRGRQYLASYLASLTGTRAAGHVLTRQEGASRWSVATYALVPGDRMGHGDHRDNPDRGLAR